MEAMVILLTSDVRIADLRRRRILSIVRSVGNGFNIPYAMFQQSVARFHTLR